jgi:hypothetical protein
LDVNLAGETVGNGTSSAAAILASTDPTDVLRNDLNDREAARQWSRGPVVMVGDAAHPMRPHLGLGGCQGLEAAMRASALVPEARASRRQRGAVSAPSGLSRAEHICRGLMKPSSPLVGIAWQPVVGGAGVSDETFQIAGVPPCAPHVGHAPEPWLARTFSATRICWSSWSPA